MWNRADVRSSPAELDTTITKCKVTKSKALSRNNPYVLPPVLDDLIINLHVAIYDSKST
jgi:hypothetical protein